MEFSLSWRVALIHCRKTHGTRILKLLATTMVGSSLSLRFRFEKWLCVNSNNETQKSRLSFKRNLSPRIKHVSKKFPIPIERGFFWRFNIN